MSDGVKTKSGKAKYVILVLLTALIVGLDQLTKALVTAHFHLGESISLISGFFNLTYVQNTGAAFGILSQANPAFRIPFFVIVPLVALGAIAYIFRTLPPNDRKLSTALSLVIGGAIGNLIDRIQLGYVVDFLDFHWGFRYHFPAFNVADSAICVGVGILMLHMLMNDETKAKKVEEPSTNASTTS